jgi:hypothetical protein
LWMGLVVSRGGQMARSAMFLFWFGLSVSKTNSDVETAPTLLH